MEKTFKIVKQAQNRYSPKDDRFLIYIASSNECTLTSLISVEAQKEHLANACEHANVELLIKDCSIKFCSKHSIVLVLCLLRNLMEQTLNNKASGVPSLPSTFSS